MKTFKELTEITARIYSKMSDKELIKWLEDNWTDEAGIGKVVAGQLKHASKEASKRKLKWSMK